MDVRSLTGNDKATEGARDTDGVDGADGSNEPARERDGGQCITELARDMDGVRGRSRSGAGGAMVHPKKDVRIAISDGCVSEAGGDVLESSVVGVRGGSSSDMDSVGRVTEERVERSELTCVEVCNTL
jgi:hypothetical protein